MTTPPDLDEREIALLLAAVTLWDQTTNTDEDEELTALATGQGAFDPLTFAERDRLYERLERWFRDVRS